MANTKWQFVANNALDFEKTKEERKVRWNELFKMGQKIEHMPTEKISDRGYFKKKSIKEVDKINSTEE